MKSLKPHAHSGFILIEVMIALILFGMMTYGGIGLYREVQRHKKQTETRDRQEKILRSLASHALIYGRLPWAGSREAPLVTQGQEQTGLTEGIIPFKTLGLQLVDSQDGFGRFFTYAITVTRPAAVSISPWEEYCRAYPVNPLRCEGYRFEGDKDFIIVAILSGGEQRQVPVLGRDEEGHLILQANIQNGTSQVWVTRNTLASAYGGLSCSPFHQPLPDNKAANTSIPRGFGR